MPVDDWARWFLLRQSDHLKERFAMNIKRNRAKISRSTVNEFFDNLTNESQSTPPENIFNYDETNLSDDPGRKKLITKRGCRYPERIINSSKSCISIMFCGSASAVFHPRIRFTKRRIYTTLCH